MSAAQDPGPRIPYDIVYCSSEDEPFPVTELLKEDDAPGHRGWQTAKNPKYPQSLVLRFRGDVDLRQIQVLSHECKIASKVEVRVFSLHDNGIDIESNPNGVPSFRDVRFVKLGSVGFNSNEKSKYRSKERKTVHLKSIAYFLKLNFQKCHSNTFNTSNQVGVYSIVCCGYPITQTAYHVDPPLVPAYESDARNNKHGYHEEEAGRSASAMSEHGLPPIQGARAGSHPQWQKPVGATPQPSNGNAQTAQAGHAYGYDPQQQQQGYNYYTPSMPSLTPGPKPLPQIYHRATPQRNAVQFHTPNHKHNTAHPHDVPSIPDPHSSNAGYTYRSQTIVDFDSIYSGRTEELVRIKAKSVDEEDFDSAKECKDALKHLHHAAQHVYELEREKVRCIYSEDFDEAKHFKIEMDNYLGELYVTVPEGVDRFLGGAPAQGGLPVPPLDGRGSVPRVGRRTSSGRDHKGPVVDMPPIERHAAGGVKHSFEEEPVRSKYAIAMAQRREEHPSDDEEAGADDDGEEEADVVNQSSGDAPHHNTSAAAEHSAADDELAGDVSGQVDDGVLAGIIDAFDVNTMPKWEQDVYRAIHAEAQDDTPAVPVASNGGHTEAAECTRVLGSYMTACLLSKKWKHREAAIRALTAGLASQIYTHVPAANVLQVILKFFEVKGFGLQDTIANVFIATCVLVQNTLQDKYECLNAVLPQALNLLPRFVSRAGDATQKTRDEAAATVMAYAMCSEVGASYVLNMIIADPIDQDKRRIPVSNQRVQIARLGLWQQVVASAKSSSLTTSMIDASMHKLFVPCLNHSSSEVRDLAVSVVTTLMDGSSLDFSKYIAMVSNATVQAALDAKGGNTPAPSGQRRNSAGKQRNSSAGKQRNNSAPRKATQNRLPQTVADGAVGKD